MKHNPFQVLGLPLSATPQDVIKAFRDRAKTLHPDAGGDAEQFKLVSEAYAALKGAGLKMERQRWTPKPVTQYVVHFSVSTPTGNVVWIRTG